MESQLILKILKKCLRANKVTYKDVASHLGISEASVKRMFHLGDMSLSRLEEISSMLNMSLLDLIRLEDSADKYLSELDIEQEYILVKDPKLLLVLFLLLNGWHLDEIESNFCICNVELTKALVSLDKLNLIRLMPLNKVKLLTTRNFKWKKNGPVQRLFEEEILKDFLSSKFSQKYADLNFSGGTLSAKSFQLIKDKLQDVAKLFDELCFQDSKLPLSERESYGAILAIRQWQYSGFEKLRRNKAEK